MTRRVRLLAGAGIAVMTAGLVGASLVPAGAETAQAETAETATGVVFEDLDRDGSRDDGEPGVEGVPVSNGLDVVLTDAQGRYSLAVDDQTIIFVSKPAGWMVPVNDVQLPQFYYTHYPNGTPYELRYGGLEPTGPLPSSVDFPLHRDDSADETFTALAFADPQTRNVGEIEDLAVDVIAGIVGHTDATFGLTVGDIVNDPLDLFAPHNEAVARIGIPWWNTPGNHDQDYDAPTDENATDTYKATFGPTDYSFDYGRVHFVLMDNVEHAGPGHGYRGYLSAEQLQWLENDLRHVPEDKLVVIGTHIPLATDATASTGVNTVNVAELFELLETREHIYTIAGHDTSNSWQMYLGPERGWFGPGAFHHQVLAEVRGGGWTTGPTDERGVQAADMADGNPNGHYEIEFDGTTYTPSFKPASLPEDYQIRLTFDGGWGDEVRVPGGPSGSAGFAPGDVRFHARDWIGGNVPRPAVTANVFDGGERHSVEISVDGGPFVPMTHLEPANDPYISVLRSTLSGSERPPAPEPSSHLWSSQLPRGLRVGEHTVTVRSTDPHDQVSETSSTFEVIPGRP
ncbi:calcineurin-like phosphoesterase C-terminal domain-containing protein [Jiangella gansuensis]|uniref:calcineurin-like phosphoesterase C-terminal domain-containing protein n=1 Tax=Jiangella gansuensis TaxID=281473 RepID=UPI0004B5DB31|nr:calcineurin-like phosphoesterase C-terminal domain-containing protein [Jiangella gansuensis]